MRSLVKPGPGSFWLLLLQNLNVAEPFLDKQGPDSIGRATSPQAERVSAAGEKMGFRRNTRGFKSPRIDRAVARLVGGIVPGHQQEDGRRLPGHLDSRVEGAIGTAEMAREKQDGEIRPATGLIFSSTDSVARLEDIAHLRAKISTGGKAHHTNLPAVDLQFLRFRADQSDRALCVLQRLRDLGGDMAFAFAVPIVIRSRNAILGHYTGHPL